MLFFVKDGSLVDGAMEIMESWTRRSLRSFRAFFSLIPILESPRRESPGPTAKFNLTGQDEGGGPWEGATQITDWCWYVWPVCVYSMSMRILSKRSLAPVVLLMLDMDNNLHTAAKPLSPEFMCSVGFYVHILWNGWAVQGVFERWPQQPWQIGCGWPDLSDIRCSEWILTISARTYTPSICILTNEPPFGKSVCSLVDRECPTPTLLLCEIGWNCESDVETTGNSVSLFHLSWQHYHVRSFSKTLDPAVSFCAAANSLVTKDFRFPFEPSIDI